MKGQYFSFDAIVASVIFILALVALLSYWHSIKSFLDYQNDPISKDAIKISNLIFAPPSPSSNCADIERFGLGISWNDRRVDASLLDCAIRQSSIDPEWLSRTLGTPYTVCIVVTEVADLAHGKRFVNGADPSVDLDNDGIPDDVDDVVKLRRTATVYDRTDGSNYLATFDVILYK